MDNNKFILESFISHVLSKSDGNTLRPGSKRIVTTLITCFSVFLFKNYFSGKEESVNGKDLERFIRAFTVVVERIRSLETPDEAEMKYVKYWCDYYMCKLFRDDQYPVRHPSWNLPLFTGILRKFILRSIIKKNARFIYSLQKGTKAGCLPLNVWSLANALRSHSSRLTREPVDLEQDALTEIELVVDEIFSDTNLGPRTKFCPSGSACYEFPRSKGGCSAFVNKLNFTNEDGGLPPLWNMNLELNNFRKSEFARIRFSTQSKIDEDPLSQLHAGVVAVDDPLKKRIITKHNGLINTALQPIQGQMLHAWKTCKYSTMRGQDCTEVVLQVDKIELPYLISGDYEAATDLINKSACEAVLGRLLDREVPDSALALYSQSGVILHYPEISNERILKERGGKRRQLLNPTTFIWEDSDAPKEILFPKCTVHALEGQTMGGPVSFSTLCVINLAAYRLAVKIWRDRPLGDDPLTTLEERHDSPIIVEYMRRVKITKDLLEHVVINGDDILFKSDDELYEIWKQTVTKFGLKPSQGKNFKSKDFCTINSQLFMRVNGVLTRQGYLNQGMLYGLDDYQLTNPIQFAQGLNEMFETCPEATPILPLVMQRFNNRYGDFSPNWFIHPALGGFGIKPKFAIGPITVTKDQQAMATEFKRNPNLALHRLERSEDATNFSPTIRRIYDSVIKVKIVQGDYVPLPNEVPIREIDWVARFSLIQYLQSPGKFTTDRGDYKNVRMRRSKRKKLMDKEKCLNHDIRFFATNPVPCPPLQVLPKKGSWEWVPLQEIEVVDKIPVWPEVRRGLSL